MSKGKILVVDDDRLVLATVTHGLAKAGYDIIDADNGDDAILLARQHRPDLALLDIRMEGMSGFDVAAYLRESLQTPFMFLSAFADDDTVAQVKALGAVAYLVKPLDIAQIVPTVEAALVTVRARKAATLASPRRAASAARAGAPRSVRPLVRLRAVARAFGRADHRAEQHARPAGRHRRHRGGRADAPLLAVAPRGAGSPAPHGVRRRPADEGRGGAAAGRGRTARASRRGLTAVGVAALIQRGAGRPPLCLGGHARRPYARSRTRSPRR